MCLGLASGYVPPKHEDKAAFAEWKKISPAGIYECTNCKQHILTHDIGNYAYCCSCGARMKKDEQKNIVAPLSEEVIEKAVKEYWKENYPQDVIVFFHQKYEHEDDTQWEWCEELVECHGSDDYDNMTFLDDFCEGQTCVKNITVVPLSSVTGTYSAMWGFLLKRKDERKGKDK